MVSAASGLSGGLQDAIATIVPMHAVVT